jgi:hypothetical protein
LSFHCFVGVDRVEEACRVGLELARGITSIERWPRLLKGWLVPIRTHWRRRTGHRPMNLPPADDDILVVDEFADTVVPEV